MRAYRRRHVSSALADPQIMSKLKLTVNDHGAAEPCFSRLRGSYSKYRIHGCSITAVPRFDLVANRA
jgi:hypothetical protein